MKISVITAVYNSVDTVASCIDSVAGQTCTAEHILIDGMSDDGTLDVLSANSDQISLLVSEKDEGIYDAMNKGIRLASSDVIGILNSDDCYCNNQVLEDVLHVFSEYDVDACYGNLVYVHEKSDDKKVRYWKAGSFTKEKFYNGWMPPHPTFFVKKSIYDKYGLFRLDMGSSADYELMLRFLFVHNISVHYLDKTLVKMRTGGASNRTILARVAANRMDKKSWVVNGIRPRPWTFMLKPVRKLTQWIV